MNKNKILYPILIFVVWLVTYIVCQVFFEQKLGWDEVNYMGVARGIATDLDFSSRIYTVMGILKFGYPSCFINFPIFSIYLATFFKLFGISLSVAYFASWFAALGVCFLIYFIFLLFSKDSYLLAFIASLSYLFCPGILKNCDSAMMEQYGCFLLCLFVYLILKDYIRGVFNISTLLKIAISLLVLWLYKSLYIGYIFGIFIFICLAYSSKISGKRLNSQFKLVPFVILSYLLFIVLFYISAKFIFLPVAPMMSFSQEQEINQTYVNFLGGFFDNFSHNLSSNFSYFLNTTLAPYFIYPSVYKEYYPELLRLTGYYVFLGFYFLIFIIMTIITFTRWKKLPSEVRVFLAFTIVSIITFNLAFNVLFRSNNSNIWRYNVYYLPIYICAFWLILKENFNYLKPFCLENPLASKLILSSLFFFVYVPLFSSTLYQYFPYEEWFHQHANRNAQIVTAVIGDSKPKFIYLNDGTHTTFVTYPTRVIIKDATNEQLIKINEILEEPISYLFLTPNDWLFKENQEQIKKAEPILNGQYAYYAYVKDTNYIVYKLIT